VSTVLPVSKAISAVAEERKVPYLVVTGATDDITQQKIKYVVPPEPHECILCTGLMSFLNTVVKPKNNRDSLREFRISEPPAAEDMVHQAKKAGFKGTRKGTV